MKIFGIKRKNKKPPIMAAFVTYYINHPKVLCLEGKIRKQQSSMLAADLQLKHPIV